MVIARDRINHGYRLPKIIPGDVINLGVKSTFVYGIFVSLQTAILYLTAYAFDLPIFDLHHLLLNFNETIDMFFANSPEYMLTFIFVGVLYFISQHFLQRFPWQGLQTLKSSLQHLISWLFGEALRYSALENMYWIIPVLL